MKIKRYFFLIIVLIGLTLPMAAGDFEPFDIGPSGATTRVLVVMEKTEFKLSVLQGVAKAFDGQGILFHVEPFQAYSTILEIEWNVILIMAPVYSDNVAAPTADFLNGVDGKDKVFLLATSGDAEFQMQSSTVDTIASVSLKPGDSGSITSQVIAALEERL
jgi:hypothetical protein